MAPRLLPALILAVAVVTTPVRAGDPTPAPPPNWSQLSAEQKAFLAPLASDWDNMVPEHRVRWLMFSQKYPTLPKDEQERIRAQIQRWAALTPDQRAEARRRWKEIQQLPPDKRKELAQKWLEYRNLPDANDRLRPAPAPKP